MKKRIGVVILVLICLCLCIVLIAVKEEAVQTPLPRAGEINSLSNNLVLTRSKLAKEVQRSTTFEKDLAESKRAYSDLTNTFTQVCANLSQASTDLAKTEAALKAKEEEVKERDAKITELEDQNQTLDNRALELGASITNLTVQIEDTKRRLAASEGDKAILETNLKRLIAERAELERQFNDITILRKQVAKLNQEIRIARRHDWIRRGLVASGEQRGAQKLIEGIKPLRLLALTPKPKYDLNVEVTSDGGAKVIPPPNAKQAPATNSPPK